MIPSISLLHLYVFFKRLPGDIPAHFLHFQAFLITSSIFYTSPTFSILPKPVSCEWSQYLYPIGIVSSETHQHFPRRTYFVSLLTKPKYCFQGIYLNNYYVLRPNSFLLLWLSLKHFAFSAHYLAKSTAFLSLRS